MTNIASVDLKLTGNLMSKLSWARCRRYWRHDRPVAAIFVVPSKYVRCEVGL